MGIIGGTLGYWLLRRICPDGETGYMDGSAYNHKSKLEALLGTNFWQEIDGKVDIPLAAVREQKLLKWLNAAHTRS